jgi:hypothetical protein
MKFREHRGSLDAAMETLVELDPTVSALVSHLNNATSVFEFKAEDLRLKYTGPDSRIGWKESWYVYFEGFGVIGMSDCVPDDAPSTAFDQPKAPEANRLKIRKNISNFANSIANIATLPSTTEALLEHLGLMWGRQLLADHIRLHRRKQDRRIGWSENWAVEVIDAGIPSNILAFIDSVPDDIPHSCVPCLYEKELEAGDKVKVSAINMPDVPTGVSAYSLDTVRSGLGLTAHWEIMYESSKPVLEEFVLWNRESGQRVLIKLEAQSFKFN